MAVSSVSSANQYGLQQLRLQQAKRNAEQAEQTAQSLAAQANSAQRTAQSAQDNADALSVQSSQAQSNANQTRQGVAALSSEQQAVSRLASTADQVIERTQPATTTTTATTATQSTSSTSEATSTAASVVNSQGQVTGTIINTTA